MKMIFQMLTMLFWALNVTFDEGGAIRLQWPSGRCGLPTTMYGCPNAAGFAWAPGNITQALNPNNKQSNSFHLKATVTTKDVQRSFCMKDVDSPDPARPVWPAGKYCIYRKGGQCPKGLKPGSLLWNNRFDLNYKKNSGVVPDGRLTSSNTLIYFCCAMNGDKAIPIPLPLESPFYLLAYLSKACQEVRGALHRTEFIFYDTDGTNTLTRPYPYGAKIYKMKINYCYYQACWTNLTALNGTIMSPFYPTNYPSNVSCRWRIEVPVDYIIRLEFQDIDIDMELSSACTKDWLKVTTGNPATSFKYCRKKTYPPLETRSNIVILDFHSDGVSSSNKGFIIKYQAKRIPAFITTTGQPTVSEKTTIATTTRLPTRTTTTTPEQENTIGTQDPTILSTEGPHDVTTRPSSSYETPAVLGAGKKDSSHAVWIIPVAVCLSTLVVTVLVLLLYLKCSRKRNRIRRRHSTVKYNRECEYVDMEIHSDKAFGIRSNPNHLEIPIQYDNYPGDDREYSEPKKQEVQVGPIYEEVRDPPASSEKGQGNNVYESMAAINDYERLVYESATLPKK